MMVIFSTVVSRIPVIDFVLLACVYVCVCMCVREIGVLIIVKNMPSIYIIFILIIVLEIKIITTVHIYPTAQSSETVSCPTILDTAVLRVRHFLTMHAYDNTYSVCGPEPQSEKISRINVMVYIVLVSYDDNRSHSILSEKLQPEVGLLHSFSSTPKARNWSPAK